MIYKTWIRAFLTDLTIYIFKHNRKHGGELVYWRVLMKSETHYFAIAKTNNICIINIQ